MVEIRFVLEKLVEANFL